MSVQLVAILIMTNAGYLSKFMTIRKVEVSMLRFNYV